MITVTAMEIISVNRKARYDYAIKNVYQAGIVLTGSEIKAIRDHQVELRDSFAVFKGHELFLINAKIQTYRFTTMFQPDPRRARKLLLNHSEILKIQELIQQQKLVAVPLKIYLKGHLAKVEIGLGQPQKRFDKRRVVKEREAKRQITRAKKYGR